MNKHDVNLIAPNTKIKKKLTFFSFSPYAASRLSSLSWSLDAYDGSGKFWIRLGKSSL